MASGPITIEGQPKVHKGLLQCEYLSAEAPGWKLHIAWVKGWQ